MKRIGPEQMDDLALGAARQSLLKLRRSEEIGDDAFHLIEEELDRAELGAQG